MARRVVAAVLAAALLAPLPALAASFSTSFPPQAAASWVESDKGVIVVEAGTASEDRTEAAAALVSALRESGKLPLVMDGNALGDVGSADDATIVKKAGHLPVDRVAVLRVFPGAADAAGTAVVTIYDMTGTALGGYSIKAGEALAARADESPRGGLGTRAAKAVEAITTQQVATNEKAQAEYDLKYVWFEDYLTVTANQYGAHVGTASAPVQGKHAKPLEGASFYEVVGQPELASSYRTRNAWKQGLFWGGLVTGIGGAVLLYPALTAGLECDFGDAKCEDDADARRPMLLGTSIGLMGVGTIAYLVGAGLNAHPVELDEARRLADEYNGKLKKDLGLSAMRKEQEPALQLDAGLMAHDGGGSIAVSGRF